MHDPGARCSSERHAYVDCPWSKWLQLDPKELMTYPLTPVPYSLATADGYIAKTDKAKAFQLLTKDCTDMNVSQAKVTLTVYDGNATFYYMKDIPANFSQICSKVFDTIGKTDVVHLFVS